MDTGCKPTEHCFGMCTVEFQRYKELIESRATEGKPDSFFTSDFEIVIRQSGIGADYFIRFDGDQDQTCISHHEHF
jgi:hypothetical protein